MPDRETSAPQGLTWHILKQVFPVASSLRREHWDRLFSRLPLGEDERGIDDRFYECLLYRFRRDAQFLFDVDNTFLSSEKKKDRDRAFSPRAMKWLAERLPAPPDAASLDLDDIPPDRFDEGTPERELHGILLGLRQFEEDRAAERAAQTEDEWRGAAARLREILERLETPDADTARRAEAAAEAFLEASRRYREEVAVVERDRGRIKTALEALAEDARAAAILERLETLDRRGIAKLAELAAQGSKDMARTTEIAAEMDAGEADYNRLAAEGASWAARGKRAAALADLEAEREGLREGLSGLLDRMAAALESSPEPASSPAAARIPKRKNRARPAEETPAPALDPAPPEEEGAGVDTALPATWEQLPVWCEERLADCLVLSPKARSTIKKTQYKDVETAAKCLLWLARNYRRARLDGPGEDLRGPIESGLWNDRCGGDSFRFPWNGKRVDVEWHVKNGGNTTDPARCLRIYYFWDEPAGKVVVASMPDHIPNGAI